MQGSSFTIRINRSSSEEGEGSNGYFFEGIMFSRKELHTMASMCEQGLIYARKGLKEHTNILCGPLDIVYLRDIL